MLRADNFLHDTMIRLENNTKEIDLGGTFNFSCQIRVDTYNTNNKRVCFGSTWLTRK